ncbi:MAG TPA: hypothetical protein VF670_13025 [Duganella sp.]|jgi:ATP-binding cassette subfamily B protein
MQIFDEATSALDPASEHAIQLELKPLSKNRSIMIIAHRLSTVVGADEIIVLEHGRIEGAACTPSRCGNEVFMRTSGSSSNVWNRKRRSDRWCFEPEAEWNNWQYRLSCAL